MSQEISPSGAPILRHEARDREVDFAQANEQALEAISEHVEKYIGKIDHVFHELVSDLVHIDVLIVNPTPEKNYYTLVTSGMSNLPMQVPEGAEDFRYAELMLCLPSDWKMSQEAFQQEENYWPIHWLKRLARMPHEYDTWLFDGHTIPNGDPAEPYASNTKLAGMLLSVPATVTQLEEFFTLRLPDERKVHFFSLLPLYKEEMDFKLKQGNDKLVEKLHSNGVNEIVNLNRKNVARKTFWFF